MKKTTKTRIRCSVFLGPEYTKYIKSERWKAKRELYWAKNGRWCRACGGTDNLIVHHMTYDHFMREPLTDLMGLCYADHKEVHRLHRASGRRVDLRTITLRYVSQTRLLKARRK